MKASTPGAFFSYARFDDSLDNGRLSELRERLAKEVRAQTGDSFEIWQDRESIRWGEQWKERIEHAIDTLTFLIVVVTPSWFKSVACRGEFERFLEVERVSGRADLILPIVYIDTPLLHDTIQRRNNPIATELAKRQLFRIDNLRNRKWMASNIGREIENMAIAIRDALQRQSVIATGRTEPLNTASGVSIEFQHVIQMWDYSPFSRDGRRDLHEEHLLRVWLVNNERIAANYVEGSVIIPNGLAWEQSAGGELKKIAFTNDELIAGTGYFDGRRHVRKPLLPSRRMAVHEERIIGAALRSCNDYLAAWETGADSFAPNRGEIRLGDIPTSDERSVKSET